VCLARVWQGVVVAPQTAFKVVNGLTSPIANATVTVCAALTGGIPCSPALANSIFKNAALTQPLSNPFTADSTGNYQFAIAPGNYTVTVTSFGFVGQLSDHGGHTDLAGGRASGSGSEWSRLRNGLNTTRPAASADIISLWTGSCNVGTVLRGDGSCAPFTSAFSGITTGTSTSQGLYGVGNGTFLQPVNFGRVISTGSWMYNTDPQPSTGPTWVSNNSAGTLTFNQTYGVEITYNSAVGETTPNAEVQHQLAIVGCGSGSCQIVVTAPTLPTGFTGYTAYARNFTASQPMQQIATCVNITGTCTFGTIPTTSSPPVTNPLVPTPPNALTSECPPNVSPIWWLPDTVGNMHAQAYLSQFVDSTNGPPSPGGTFVECRRHWFTSGKIDPPGGKNALVVIDSVADGRDTVQTNQDRALWVNNQNVSGDSSQHYSITGVQTEVDVFGAPTWQAAPDNEVAAFSGQVSDLTTNSNGPNSVAVGRFSYSRQNNGGQLSASGVVAAIKTDFTNNGGGFSGGSIWVGNQWSPATTGTLTNLNQVGNRYVMGARGTSTAIIGTLAGGAGLTPTAGSDWFNRNDVHNWHSMLNSGVWLNGISASDLAAVPVNASLNITPSVTVSQIASSWTTGIGSVTCSGGASTYGYTLVAVDNNGGQVASAQSASSAACANPLTSGNPATLNNPSPAQIATNSVWSQAKSIDVYRTFGPMAFGKIGTITCGNEIQVLGCTNFVDTGLAASGTIPSTNTTGGATVAGYLHSSLNTVQLASDFTSAANTSLQTIGVLTWNLDGNAKKYSFHCSLMYSQATAAVAMQFGIQAATVNPNDISAKGRVDTSTSAQTSGVLSNLATTTATSIVTFTPSATATVFGADLDGSIDEPANNQGQVVNIMVQTSNSSDLPTVKRGSYCTLY
jgi:hypothetical protein